MLSTTLALLNKLSLFFEKKASIGFDNNKSTDFVPFDLVKPFGTVPHDKLVHNVSEIKTLLPLLVIIDPHFSGRDSFVEVNDK